MDERPRDIRIRGQLDAHERDGSRRDPTSDEIAAYLRRHPDFLRDFPDLALALTLPRQQGPTTSLAGYQLEVLRDKNRALNRRLHELLAIASENEQLMVRVHAFTLSLMRATTPTETLQRVVATLNEDLNTDLVRLTLFHPVEGQEGAEWLLVVARDDPALRPFAEFLGQGRAALRAPDAGEAGGTVRRPHRGRAFGRAGTRSPAAA